MPQSDHNDYTEFIDEDSLFCLVLAIKNYDGSMLYPAESGSEGCSVRSTESFSTKVDGPVPHPGQVPLVTSAPCNQIDSCRATYTSTGVPCS